MGPITCSNIEHQRMKHWKRGGLEGADTQSRRWRARELGCATGYEGKRTSREPTLAATSPGLSPCGKLASESVTSDWRASARPPAERDVGTAEGFVERTCREGRHQIES